MVRTNNFVICDLLRKSSDLSFRFTKNSPKFSLEGVKYISYFIIYSLLQQLQDPWIMDEVY